MLRLTYRTIDDPRLRGWLVKERVRCGDPGCHCSTGRKHGSCYYLYYRAFDLESRVYRLRKTYVKASRAAALRRQIRRAKAEVRGQHESTRVFLASMSAS